MKLTTLNLSNNKIEGRVDKLNFPSLVTLNLSNNNITGFEETLLTMETFRSLVDLDVSRNQIDHLE